MIIKRKIMPTEHFCKHCNTLKPISEWHLIHNQFTSMCKECFKKYRNSRYKKYRELHPSVKPKCKQLFKNSGLKWKNVFKDMIKAMEKDYNCAVSVHMWSPNPRKRSYLVRFDDRKGKIDLEKHSTSFFNHYIVKVIGDNRASTRVSFYKYLRRYLRFKSIGYFDPVMEQMGIEVQKVVDEYGSLTIANIRRVRALFLSKYYEDPDCKKPNRFELTKFKDYLHRKNIIPKAYNITPSKQKQNLPRTWEFRFKPSGLFKDSYTKY